MEQDCKGKGKKHGYSGNYRRTSLVQGSIVGIGKRIMEKEQNTITTTLRLPEERNEYIKKKANEIGISQNAFVMLLIDLGIKFYESDIKFNSEIK